MSGRFYDQKVMQAAIDNDAARQASAGGIVIQSDNLPKELEGKKALTLDQIDARRVRVEVSTKKSYRIPRVRITNTTIRLMVSPALALPVVKDVLRLAVEARRRLRHPNNQPQADPIPGIAYGRLGAPDEKFWDVLTVTIDGKDAVRVKVDELEKEEPPKAEPKLVIG